MDQKDIIEFCECNVLHPEKIEIAHKNLLDNESISLLTLFFKTFSDPTRMKIILALKETELCVCDLSAVISVSQSAVSHQLKTLRENRLVKYRVLSSMCQVYNKCYFNESNVIDSTCVECTILLENSAIILTSLTTIKKARKCFFIRSM